jgi:RNA polymerase sigma-70 factor (ECF subfamily)
LRKSNQSSLGQLSDETLIARVARSDRNALETLYDRHAPMVMGISLKITSDRAASEEVLQETFWQVWQGAASYQGQGGSFTSWLFKIARTLAIDASQWKLNRK